MRAALGMILAFIGSAALADEPLVCHSVVDPTKAFAINCNYSSGRYVCDENGNNCEPEIKTIPGCSTAVYRQICLPADKWILENRHLMVTEGQ